MERIKNFLTIVAMTAILVAIGFVIGDTYGNNAVITKLRSQQYRLLPIRNDDGSVAYMDYIPIDMPDNGALAMKNKNPLNIKALKKRQVGRTDRCGRIRTCHLQFL